MSIDKLSEILKQLLDVNIVADDAAIKRLPAMQLRELEVIENHDTSVTKYKLEVYGESKTELNKLFSKIHSSHAFEMSEDNVRSICILRCVGALNIDYKDHIFKGSKNVELQIIRTRVAA